jgi:anti-sigma factor RsiW
MSTIPAPTATPAVPPIVRTVAYFALLIASVLVLIAVGLAPIWLDPTMATKVVASGGVITSAFGVLAGGLGVAYRPTAAANQPAILADDDDQDGSTEGTAGIDNTGDTADSEPPSVGDTDAG